MFPCRQTKPLTFADCIGDELPVGWEEAYDPVVGAYYVDHNTSESRPLSVLPPRTRHMTFKGSMLYPQGGEPLRSKNTLWVLWTRGHQHGVLVPGRPPEDHMSHPQASSKSSTTSCV